MSNNEKDEFKEELEEVNEEGELIEKATLRRDISSNANFKIFDLSSKRFKASSLNEVLNLASIVLDVQRKTQSKDSYLN